MLKLFLLATLSILGTVQASKEFKCVCNNQEKVVPECGLCGTENGKMGKTNTGVECYCENGLKSHEIECSAACEKHGGWTGDHESS